MTSNDMLDSDLQNSEVKVGDSPNEAARPPWSRVVTLVAGQALSMTGDYILLVAMAWNAVQYGGASAVTLLALAAAIPRSIMLVFGGAFADVRGPRFVLLRTTSARVVLLA